MREAHRSLRSRQGFVRDGNLQSCIGEYLVDVESTNIVSALTRAFVSCFEGYRGKEDYISAFSREASLRLRDLYRCENVQVLLEEIAKRMDEIYNSLRRLDKVYSFVVLMKIKTVSRLTIHTRSPYLPLEIALSWDPILNVPFIPATALKGIARSFFEINSISIDGLRANDIFGSTESEGLLIFSDAYPVACEGQYLIEPEVITPHYSEVENRIDEASSRPIPLVFPVIAPNTVFSFVVAIRRNEKINNPSIAMKILDRIAQAYTLGIGAKTALGYGRIRIL